MLRWIDSRAGLKFMTYAARNLDLLELVAFAAFPLPRWKKNKRACQRQGRDGMFADPLICEMRNSHLVELSHNCSIHVCKKRYLHRQAMRARLCTLIMWLDALLLMVMVLTLMTCISAQRSCKLSARCHDALHQYVPAIHDHAYYMMSLADFAKF